MPDIEMLVNAIEAKDVIPIKEHIVALYYRELFERQIYMGQIMKLDGDIVEILKRLSAQEEMHANWLMGILGRSNIKVKEYFPTIPKLKISAPLEEAVEYDVEQEEISSAKYAETIAKAAPAMKAFLQYILYEEYEHIRILKAYLAKSTKEKGE
jgi:rubrerythrin